jgi:hypothetical protein
VLPRTRVRAAAAARCAAGCLRDAQRPRLTCALHARLALQGARQGFALAFAGALSVLPCVSTKAAMDILQSYSEPVTGSAKVRIAGGCRGARDCARERRAHHTLRR